MAKIYYCNACEWQGSEEDTFMACICPSCMTGHKERLVKMSWGYLCPKCSAELKEEDLIYEAECPKCGNQYLIEVEGGN